MTTVSMIGVFRTKVFGLVLQPCVQLLWDNLCASQLHPYFVNFVGGEGEEESEDVTEEEGEWHVVPREQRENSTSLGKCGLSSRDV